MGEVPIQALQNEKLQVLPTTAVLEKYRWEIRTVTREGLVSFDGIRYGVPWQYSGREVRVRLCDGCVEIYFGQTQIAKHGARYKRGHVIWLPRQYAGLAERNGVATSFSHAHLTDSNIEERKLSVYDELLEVASNG